MAEEYVVQMKGITKVYPNGIAANQGVDLNIRRGEIHALMGENGAGKSTLMKMLFGLEQPTEGEIWVNGEKVNLSSPTVAISKGIGMVHQHFMLVPSLTVAENMVLGMVPKKSGLFIDKKKAVELTEEYSKRFNLHVDPTAKVMDIPVGMKQKVEILKALVRGAKILILDEPTAVLTTQETTELFRELVNLKKDGYTIIFISHKLNEIMEITDRMTILRGGRSMGVHNTSDVTPEVISRLMVGRDVVLKVEKDRAKPTDEVLRVRDLEYVNEWGKKMLDKVSFSVRKGEILGIAGVEGNGQKELVVEFRGIGDLPRLVLGYFDGELKGSIYYNRQMDQIKEDGTFYYSGGIGNRGWARLQKFDGHWVEEELEGDYFSLPDTLWTQWVPQDTEPEPEATDDTEKAPSELHLTYWKDGALSSVPADLFIGEGFFLYVPREGWVHEVLDYHGTTADRWVCGEETLDEFGLNRMIDTTSREALRKFYDQEYPTRMTVFFRPGTDDQALRDWIMEVNPQWDMTQNARGSLFADTATVNFFPTETGVIVCILETPTFATEGLGILGAMYQSLSGWSPETAGAASDVSGREKETSFTLTRYIDSEQRWEEYPVPVQLYRAEGYSTYIPKEGFEKSEGTYGGRPALRWEYKDNRDVWFSVVPLDTTSFNEAIQWGLSAGGPGDTLIEDKSGGVSGQSTDGSLFWAITFHEKDFKGIYAVICHYPVAQTDGLAAYVKLMADEFQAE